jgi:hypothetical protein
LNKLQSGIAALLVGLGLCLLQPLTLEATGSIESAPIAAAIPIQSALPTPQETPYTGETNFEQQINHWIQSISKEPGFEDWQQAAWTKYPLGPGTHGWVIHIRKDENDIGYLVIQSTQDGGLQLQEYGRGDQPLFSLNTLHQSLMRHGLIVQSNDSKQLERIYMDPLHSVWRADIGEDRYYMDAKSGELLPVQDKHIEAMLQQAPPSATARFEAKLDSIIETVIIPAFDPFYRVNWLTDPPMVLNDHYAFQHAFHHEAQITYSTHLYGRLILCAYAVNGFQTWNDDITFVSLDYEGDRFIPYSVLAELGSFYQ